MPPFWPLVCLSFDLPYASFWPPVCLSFDLPCASLLTSLMPLFWSPVCLFLNLPYVSLWIFRMSLLIFCMSFFWFSQQQNLNSRYLLSRSLSWSLLIIVCNCKKYFVQSSCWCFVASHYVESKHWFFIKKISCFLLLLLNLTPLCHRPKAGPCGLTTEAMYERNLLKKKTSYLSCVMSLLRVGIGQCLESHIIKSVAVLFL